jgi:hypothetical protein
MGGLVRLGGHSKKEVWKAKPRGVVKMAKRILLGLLILAAVSGILSAQERVSIGLDLFPLAKGIIWSNSDVKNSVAALAPSFEYLLNSQLALGAAMDIYIGKALDIDILYFGLAAHGRWYPQSNQDRLFIDAGLGFNLFSRDGETDSDKGGFAGLTISLKTGYKLLLNRLFVEPSIAFVYAKTPTSASVPITPLGWQPGLSIGVAF